MIVAIFLTTMGYFYGLSQVFTPKSPQISATLSLLPTLQIAIEVLVHEVVVHGNLLTPAKIGHYAGKLGQGLQLFAHISAVDFVVIGIEVNGFIHRGEGM